jgi:hypothetical protein
MLMILMRNVIEAYKWYVLYCEYTTDVKNKQQLLSLLPQVEKTLTPTQKAEATTSEQVKTPYTWPVLHAS